MQVFILAGGYATRLWPLTEKRSKPLLPIAGKPLLTHLIEKIPASMQVTVSTNSVFEEAFDEWIQGLHRPNITLEIEDTKHEDHKLGALGALGMWLEENKIQEDVLVLTGDNYLGFDMQEFLAHFDGVSPLLAAHDIGDVSKASAFGTVLAKGTGPVMDVMGFEEKPKDPKTSLVSTGCFVLPRNTIPLTIAHAKRKPDNVGGIFEEFLAQGIAVRAFVFTDPWLDIGSFASYLAAHRLLVHGKTLLGNESQVDGETACTESVCIGDRSTIKKSTLTDCIVMDDCRIEDCVLKDCIVDDGCVLKGVDLTGKMIRAGTSLAKS